MFQSYFETEMTGAGQRVVSPFLLPDMAVSYTGAQNSAGLLAAMKDGGTVLLLHPGTYLLASWPTGIPVSTLLTLGPGVILSDGSATISGPITLEGGLWPNGRTGVEATVATAAATITCPGIGFTDADVGKYVVARSTLTTSTASSFRGTILSVDAGVATCNANIGFTDAGAAMVAVGTDNYAALAALLAARDHVELPRGIMFCAGPLVIRDGCAMTASEQPQIPELDKYPTIGSWLFFAGTTDQLVFIEVGDTGVFGNNAGGSSLVSVGVDGSFRAQIAVAIAGWTATVEECSIIGGSKFQTQMNGSSGKLLYNFCTGRGSIEDNLQMAAADHEVIGNNFRGCGANKALIRLVNSSANRIIGNHTWDADSQLCWQIRMVASGSTAMHSNVIMGNELEVGNGHTISMACSGTGTNSISSTCIANNIVYHTQTTFSDDTYDFVNTNAPASQSINGVVIRGNVGISIAARNWRSIWTDEGAVPATGVNLAGNMFNGCDDVISAGTAFYNEGNGVSDKGARTTWSAT